MHGWAPEVIGAVGTPQTSPEGFLGVFFTRSPASRQAGQESLGRMYARSEARDTPATWEAREAQYDAVCTWGVPDHGLLQRLSLFGFGRRGLLCRDLHSIAVMTATGGDEQREGEQRGEEPQSWPVGCLLRNAQLEGFTHQGRGS